MDKQYILRKTDGSMAVSEWVDNNKYYVGEDGKWIKTVVKGQTIKFGIEPFKKQSHLLLQRYIS